MKRPEPLVFAPASVRQPLLQGHQLVAALWFPAAWFGERERARRVLARWRVGATAWRFEQGDLLCLASPLEQDCEALGGWPLRQHGRALCSAPLMEDEAAAMPAADVWIVQGGQVTALMLDQGQPLDPSQWLAVGAAALHDTFDCRAALPEAVPLAPADARALREVLDGRIPPASPEQLEFLRAMAQREGGASARGGGGEAWRRPARHRGAWLAALGFIGLLVAMTRAGVAEFFPWALFGVMLLFQFFRGLGRAGTRWTSAGESAGRPQPAPVHAAEPPLPARGLAAVRPQAWRQWLARLAIASQVSRLLGRRQAAYLRHMMALFESGKLDEALRHAIPLGDGGSLGQAFGTPGPRSDLSLNGQSGASIGMHLGDDLEAYLRRLYRQSFERLDREGRIDEAVFVLAELLQARQEALDYLEKHRRFKQAAELALAWDQPADLIVRLQALAGDWRRAVAVARRDNAFANAVLQLEKKWPDAAAQLREEWAQALAAQGDWLGAVEAIWPLPAKRPLAVDWLLCAEAAGGRLGARALVQRAVLLPDTLADCAARMEELRDDPDCREERTAVAEALLALTERHPRAAQLARIVAPGLLSDQGAGRGQVGRNDLQRLLSLAGDAWLDADLPAGPLPSRALQDLTLAATPLQGRLPDPGGPAILDAVALEDGQHLVALGEAGALIVDPHGKTVARFAVPAQRIIIAQSKQVALVMARRDRVWRVSRLDLARRRVTDLGMAELEYTATEFDGLAWTVAGGTRLRVLDTQRSLHEVLWQVGDLPGQVRALSVHDHLEQVVLRDERGALELWRYVLPQRRLQARGEALPERVLSEQSLQMLHPGGGVIELDRTPREDGSESLRFHLHGNTSTIAWPQATAEGLPLQAHVAWPWLLVGLGDETRTHWSAIALATGRAHAGIAWPTASQPRARLAGGHCVVFDAQGRLWSLDTATSGMRSLSVR